MADPRLFRLRVTYRKGGRLAHLSHLEIARALERIVRRADVPFAVTQGFSPHMRIAFGSALPVGVGGTSELFDLFLTEYVPEGEIKERLCAQSPSDLMPSACVYVESSAPAVSVAYPVSTYVTTLSDPVGELIIPEEITVKRKKKEKQLIVSDYLIEAPRLIEGQWRFTLQALPTGSLRPDVFINACINETYSGVEQKPCVISMTRIAQQSA